MVPEGAQVADEIVLSLAICAPSALGQEPASGATGSDCSTRKVYAVPTTVIG